MNPFPSGREAKEFLVSRIVEEAQREGVPLSEVERKMLYFSETYWTLPDMAEVSEEFDREYDQSEYEKKITLLIKTALRRWRKESLEEYGMWRSAISVLQKEDHYILVMVSRAGVRLPSNRLSPLYKGLMAVLVLFFLMCFSVEHDFKENLTIALWIGSICVMLVYGLLRLIFGAKRTDGVVSGIIERVFGIVGREK